MITWKNLDQLDACKELAAAKKVDIAEAMSGESGAERAKKYCVPMAEGLFFNYAAKAVDDDILEALAKLAKEAQLTDKYKALLDGEVINTGEKRMVLHQLCRGQLGKDVIADGVNKRDFYASQQSRIAEFAEKVVRGLTGMAALCLKTLRAACEI